MLGFGIYRVTDDSSPVITKEAIIKPAAANRRAEFEKRNGTVTRRLMKYRL